MAMESMGLRVTEVALTLSELLPAAVEAKQVTPALQLTLKRLNGLVKSAGEFVTTYGQRGFMSRVFKSSWDAITVRTYSFHALWRKLS